MMSFTAVLLFTTFFALGTKQETSVDPAFAAAVLANRTECAKENGIELTDTGKVWADPSTPSISPAMKCYFKCMMGKLGIIDNGVTYDDHDTMQFFAHSESAAELKEIHDECKDIPPGTDECEYAYQLVKCFAETQYD